MKGREAASAPRIRPELPQRYKASQSAEIRAVLIGVACLTLAGFVLYGLAKDRDVPAWARIVLGLIALGVAAAGAVPATRVVRGVTMSDDGLNVEGMVKQRFVPWERVAEVKLGAESKAAKANRAVGAGAAMGGALGAVVGAAIAGSGGSGDHRVGDPYEDGRLREHYDPTTVLVGDDGKQLARLGCELPWSFFTALRAEAAARGIRAVRVVPAAKRAARRRR